MIVVLDTNVFVRELHLLRSGAGPVFVHFLRYKRGALFVPEILRREYVEQTVAIIQGLRQEIDSRFGRIISIMGERDDYQVPGDEQTAAAAEARLNEMAAFTVGLTLTDEVLLAAARRTLQKRPPSTKTDHGFKDCVIWESVLRLPAGSEVHLVSHDGAFFDGDALVPSLRAEAAERELTVTAHDKLEEVLRLLQDGTPPLNVERVVTVLNTALHESRMKAMGRWNIPVMTGPGTTSMVPYFTAKLDETYVTFETQYETSGATVDGTEYVAPRVVFSGSFTWFDETGQLTDLEVESEKLRGADGSTIKDNRVAFLRARLSLGRGKIAFNRRGPLLSDDNKKPAG